jgi:hypothetical protein
MARMTLVQDWMQAGTVTISYDDEIYGRRAARHFRTPPGCSLGYVREIREDGTEIGQVCDGLACTGSPLMATRKDLASVIRREYRAMRRAEQKASK